MNKIRVYELAKLLGRTNPELLERLKTLKIDVKNHMSSIDMDAAQKIEDSFKEGHGDRKPSAKDGGAEPLKASEAAAVHEKSGTVEIIIGRSSTVGDIAKLLGKTPSEMVKLLIKTGDYQLLKKSSNL
jgi:translation initiation factor IF-2